MTDPQPPARRGRGLWRVVAPVLAVLGVGVWWLSWSARVVWPGDGAFGITVPAAEDDRVFSFGSMPLCLEGVDAAVIERVDVGEGHAVITDFAVRSQPEPDEEGIVMLLGSEPGRLADTGFGNARTVRSRCGDRPPQEFAVEVTRSGPGTARADGLLVHWSAGLRSGTVRIDGHFVLCGEADTKSPPCVALP